MYFHRNIVATAVRVSVHRMAECRKKIVNRKPLERDSVTRFCVELGNWAKIILFSKCYKGLQVKNVLEKDYCNSYLWNTKF